MISTEEVILKILRQSDISLTVDEIAKKACIRSVTVSKHLIALQPKGLIEKQEVGTTRLYSISGRKRGIF